MKVVLYVLSLLFSSILMASPNQSYQIRKTADFEVSGEGDNAAWNMAKWIYLKSTTHSALETKAKIMYSEKGLYVLFNNQDRKITATKTEDFSDLWNEDVVELFLQPVLDLPLYFEYEISPLNKHLFLLVPNHQGKFQGWKVWRAEASKPAKIVQKVRISPTNNWRAEIFIPYDLFKPLVNQHPTSGDVWQGNLYRIDYYEIEATYWSWKPVKGSFHQPETFGLFYFE